MPVTNCHMISADHFIMYLKHWSGPGAHPENFKGGGGYKKKSIPHSGADPKNFGGEGMKF